MIPARLLLVDDHQIMRDGLRLLLGAHADWKIVGSAFDTDAAWSLIVKTRPDLVIMDLELPGGGGVALTQRVIQAYPEIKVMVLTANAEPSVVRAALGAGARGYLLKTHAAGQLVLALRAVLAGQVYLCPEISTVVVQELQRRTGAQGGVESLSGREKAILTQIADGHTTKEIAFGLGVSAKTVETHRLNLMAKLGVSSVAGLTKQALRAGLTKL